MEHSEQDEEAKYRRRAGYPRFGSFVTIAVAILLLFGAASRMGKTSMGNIFSAMDVIAENRVNRGRNEAIADTLIQIGPTTVSALSPYPPVARVDIDDSAPPPSRGSVDPGYLTNQYTDTNDTPRDNRNDDGDRSNGIDFTFQTQPSAPAEKRPGSYVVADGDNWVKIAKRVLGDGKRWQELQHANPSARDGLKVGMKLTVPN